MMNSIFNNKKSILSVLLFVTAVALGADGLFAMAVGDVELAGTPNPSDEAAGGINARNASGNTGQDGPVADEAGLKTSLPGKAATATDVRDAGLEAEDFDKDVILFNKFKYTAETILAVKCKPIKVNSMVVEHFRVAQPNLDAVLTVAHSSPALTVTNGCIEIPYADFSNVGVLVPCATVVLNGVEGKTQDAGGNYVSAGALSLTVISVNESGNIKFRVSNLGNLSSIAIPVNERFIVCAVAGSESQMHTAPISFLPEIKSVYLQKKLASTIITDEFQEQYKKTALSKKDVIQYVTDIFKKQCARNHWLGESDRFDIKVPELNGSRESDYKEKGLLRQVSSIYTHGATMTNDDLMAISSIMFTEFAQSDTATAFVGKNEMKRIMKLINSATHFKDVATVSVNEYGIKVRNLVDNFGKIELIYDPMLDDLGYSDFMVVLDLSSIVRYYKRDDKVQTRDMKKSGEAREAEEWNISRTDCYCIKGGNAVLVCPTTAATSASKLGGITAEFTSTSATATSGLTTTVKYYLTADMTDGSGFKAGHLIEYDADFGEWKLFEGRIFA